MSVIRFGCVVEGHGEVTALPILIQRVVAECDRTMIAVVPPPVRVRRDRFVNLREEFDRSVQLAAANARDRHPVLLVLDSEGDCPATLGPRLLGQAQELCPGRPTGCVIAHQEYESWFLTSPGSLRQHYNLDITPVPPNDPELIRGAKEWIKRQLPRGRKYSESVDQQAITRLFNLERAKSAPSFDKLYREVARLLGEFAAG